MWPSGPTGRATYSLSPAFVHARIFVGGGGGIKLNFHRKMAGSGQVILRYSVMIDVVLNTDHVVCLFAVRTGLFYSCPNAGFATDQARN